MGLREKADFNLQFLSLVCVLVTLLVLFISRRYTSDWRERRGFRRHLTFTHRRLADAAVNDAIRNSNQTQESTGDLKDTTSRSGVRRHNAKLNGIDAIGDTHGGSRNSVRGGQQQQPRRRQWKRFVAAMPLMPLATAYVAARIGWDIFEVLVFCSIDLARDTTTAATIAAHSLVIAIQEYVVTVWLRLDVQRRTADAAVVVVEGTFGWLFNTGFPAFGRLLIWIRCRVDISIQWWIKHGGPALRDVIEITVLEFLVPASGRVWQMAVTTWNRGLWLITQTGEALRILTSDLIHDLRILYNWFVFVSDWVMDRQRWWFDRQLWHALQMCVVAVNRQCRQCLIVIERILPWCTSAIVTALDCMYTHALRPFTRWAIQMGDNLLLHTLGLCVNMSRYALIASSACIWLYEALTRGVGMLVFQFAPAAQRMATLMQALFEYLQSAMAYVTSIVLWATAICSDLYLQVHYAAVIPTIWFISAAAANIWQYMQGLEPWLQFVWVKVAEIGERIWSYVIVFAHIFGTWLRDLFLIALGTLQRQQQHLWQLTCEHGWNVCADVLASGGTMLSYTVQLLTNSVLWLERRVVLVLWPAISRGTYDAGHAMADVYTQLVATVDAVVAMIGDFVVEFARQNAVHRSHVAPTHASNNDNNHQFSAKKDA
ncbi:hypothetical protein COEREDRAFT_12281 [Coemansia reversa NRRL 1564]|uniref:Uncharacterized protein n=1 Tax=Coemansia reversa (strain ATCC 12441 / NRRL 1564) TaxID=763665 RepID=A0A2G5B170_COERN|nr:hypothetical protein COEREDRAFT_12281 [Coemansia reversa NRRL 1564]|eukprot:PIA12734.1 hypothetical protein COEREDRAFT_12281 [Coemansia reversa NRRL 1564]